MVVMDGGVACPTQAAAAASLPPPPLPVTTSSANSWYDHQAAGGHQQQQPLQQEQQQGHQHHHGDGGSGSADLAAADAYFKGQQSYFTQMQQYQGMSHGACACAKRVREVIIPHVPPARRRRRQVLVIETATVAGDGPSLNLIFHFQRNLK